MDRRPVDNLLEGVSDQGDGPFLVSARDSVGGFFEVMSDKVIGPR